MQLPIAVLRSAIPSKPYVKMYTSCKKCTLNKLTLFTMGNMYISFSKIPILFFIRSDASIYVYS